MNKRIILFVSFLAVFMMLMIPVKPSIEYQNKQIMLNPVKKPIEYTSFKKMISQIPKEEILKKLKEKNYDFIFIKDTYWSLKDLALIQQSNNTLNDYNLCENLEKACWKTYICWFIFVVTPLVIFFSIVLEFLLSIAIYHRCDFVNEWPWYNMFT